MSLTFTQSTPVAAPKPGRNDQCWCKSGKKYKKCHLPLDNEQDTTGFSALTPPQPDADNTFDDLCRAYNIPLDASMLIEWNRTRKVKDFDLTPFIELFAAYAPGNPELRRLIGLVFHILRNHPPKADHSVRSDTPHRIINQAFDVPDIDQSTAFGKANKAVALTKVRDYVKALTLYANIIPALDTFEEPFRITLNIGVCLVELGQMELAKRYFEKSLHLKPDYTVAQNNIRLFNNSRLVMTQRIAGRGRLIPHVLENHTWLDGIDTTSCPLVSDMRTVLTHIDTTKVSVTEKQRMIVLRDAKRLNRLLTHPDPDTQTIRIRRNETFSQNARNYWDYPQLAWIVAVAHQAGLLRFEKGRLRLSRLGSKTSLAEPPQRQLARMWDTWFSCDWTIFIRPGWTWEFETELMEQARTLAGPLLSFMADSDKPFTVKESLKEIQPIPTSQKEKLPAANTLVDHRIEKHFFHPLVSMGILTTSPKQTLVFGHRTFTVTPFGHTVLDALMTHAETGIPDLLLIPT